MLTEEFINDVGTFVDEVTKDSPYTATASAACGRGLEEYVELCLHMGLTAGKIAEHIADAIANQAMKFSQNTEQTTFPSQLNSSREFKIVHASLEVFHDEAMGEIADVTMCLAYMLYIMGCGARYTKIQQAKLAYFKTRKFRVAKNGTIYAVAKHVKTKPDKVEGTG